jgi:hypothetical protein
MAKDGTALPSATADAMAIVVIFGRRRSMWISFHDAPAAKAKDAETRKVPARPK